MKSHVVMKAWFHSIADALARGMRIRALPGYAALPSSVPQLPQKPSPGRTAALHCGQVGWKLCRHRGQ
jgi:hypothetical protein